MKKIALFSVLISFSLFASSRSAESPNPPHAQDIQNLFETIDKTKERHISFLRRLVRSTKEGEESVQRLVAERFKELGCQVDVLRVLPTSLTLKKQFASDDLVDLTERVTVVCNLQGSGNGRNLLFFAHPDSQPVTSTSRDWNHDPFEATVEDNKIFGWGVADDLAGVAIMAEAVDAVRTAGIPLQGDVYLGSTASKRNARGIIALLSRGYHADASIYVHPAESGAGLNEIKSMASGLLRFRIKVSGQPPSTTEPDQTAFAHLGTNPIDKANLIIQALKKLDTRRGETIHNKTLDAAIGRSTNLLIGHISCGTAKRLYQMPSECVISANVTFPPNEELSKVRTDIESAVADAANADPWLAEHPPSIDWLFGTPGVEVPVEHPLYQTVSAAIQAATGKTPHLNPLHSASDIRNPILFSGIPTVGIGPLGGGLSVTGGENEWVDLEDYIIAIKVCAKVIVEWCR